MGGNNKTVSCNKMRDNVVDIWKGLGGDQEEILSIEKFGGYKTEAKEIIEERERLVLRNKAKGVKHLKKYGGLREDIGMNTYPHDPLDYTKKLKLRFRVGDLDLPERRKRYTSSREEGVATHMCLCGTTIERRTHIVGECEIHKKGQDVLEEEMGKLDGCDTEEFGRVQSSEKTIAILGDRWWPQTAKQDGDRISKQFLCNIWKKRDERSSVRGVSIRSRNGAPPQKGCVVNGL